MRHAAKALLLMVAVIVLWPAVALAQEGQIAGTVRDTSGAVIPGVVVEATSPALIEKVRSATSDENGQYRLTNLPVGTYSVTFTLQGFTRQQRDNDFGDGGVARRRYPELASGGGVRRRSDP
jgi:hypothetical protein